MWGWQLKVVWVVINTSLSLVLLLWLSCIPVQKLLVGYGSRLDVWETVQAEASNTDFSARCMYHFQESFPKHFIFLLLFVFFSYSSLQWHKLIVSCKKVIASGSCSIIWCSKSLWLSGSSLKCSSTLRKWSSKWHCGVLCLSSLNHFHIKCLQCAVKKVLIFFLACQPLWTQPGLEVHTGFFSSPM